MAYSRGWFFAFLIFVASSDKVTGYLLRNLKNSSKFDDFQDVTQHEATISYQFQNHEGGVIDSPSGFLCLEVVKLDSSSSGEDKDGRIVGFSCHYKKQGVIMSSKLRDINGIFNEHFQHDSSLFLKDATYEESTNTIQITPEVQFIWLATEQSQTKRQMISSTTMTILVFHVTSDGRSTTSSVSELSDWVFGTGSDTVNVKSQYEECSFNQRIFTPASGTNINNGVVEVNISPGSTEYDAMSNSAKLYAQTTLGINVDSFDFLMFALPDSMTYNGATPTWAGLAETPGKISWYPDGKIEYVSVSMHEIGHNLGLQHSNEGNTEYDDRTCIMGIGTSTSDTSKCFNAAKMKQLGWYTSREQSIDPLSQSFSGKVIGVNDYGISTSDHVLVLEIIYSAGAGNLYLTLNKAEGMTADTGEYVDQIIVNQRLASGESDLIEHIGVGSSATIADFSGSRDLTISFVSIGSDADVDYASVDVQLVTETCTVDSECNDLNACTSDTCQNSVCSYQAIDNCCGNGSCEFESSGETCGTCTSDCSIAKGSCGAIDESDGSNSYYSVTSGGITYSLDSFISNILAKRDVAIHSIQFYMRIDQTSQASTTNIVSIFTKTSTWFDENDTSPTSTAGWTQIFGGNVASTYDTSFTGGTERHISTVELTTPVIVQSGSLQSFYIQVALGNGEKFLLQGAGTTFTDTTVHFDDTDITLYEGAHCFQALDYCRSTTMLFKGKFGYMYTTLSTSSPTFSPSESSLPSLAPSTNPSISSHPSSKPTKNPSLIPSLAPSKSFLPSSVPTFDPSKSSNPSQKPSYSPSTSATPSFIPSNSPSKSKNPSFQPSDKPSKSSIPSVFPSHSPSTSSNPSSNPSTKPSKSSIPSSIPSLSPSKSFNPSPIPTLKPSKSLHPSDAPSSLPSQSSIPSSRSSHAPSKSLNPSFIPSSNPSMTPSKTSNPSSNPSFNPSKSSNPSSDPSASPSKSSNPSPIPSFSPSIKPSPIPSLSPTISSNPSNTPSLEPSNSSQPSSVPSRSPSKSYNPSVNPSFTKSSNPSPLPSFSPSTKPSIIPSLTPTISSNPSTTPSLNPSMSSQPSVAPSRNPSKSFNPSSNPSVEKSSHPSSNPSSSPSVEKSTSPSSSPSSNPSVKKSTNPSSSPSSNPSVKKSTSPSSNPSFVPSSYPSIMMTGKPSRSPSISPSEKPTPKSSPNPSVIPTTSPIIPSLNPTKTTSCINLSKKKCKPYNCCKWKKGKCNNISNCPLKCTQHTDKKKCKKDKSKCCKWNKKNEKCTAKNSGKFKNKCAKFG